MKQKSKSSADVLAALVGTFSRDDTFPLLFALSRASEPQTLEQLSRRYGGAASEITLRLARLRELGLLRQKGRGYSASDEALAAVKSLEEMLEKTELPVAVAASAALEATSDSAQGAYASGEALMTGFSNNGNSAYSIQIGATAGEMNGVIPAGPNAANDEESLADVEGLPRQPHAA